MNTQTEKFNTYKVVGGLTIIIFIALLIEYLLFNRLLMPNTFKNETLTEISFFLVSNFHYTYSTSLILHFSFTFLLIGYSYIKPADIDISKKTRRKYLTASIILNAIFIIGFLYYPIYDLYIYPIIALVNIFVTSKAFTFSTKLKDENFFKGVNQKKSDFYFSFATKQGDLHIHIPQRNIYVDGGPGSGKSVSLIKPIIFQLVEQNGAGVIYDFEGDPTKKGNPILTKTAYNALLQNEQLDRFAFINFTDISRTYRVNILKYIQSKAEIIQLATALMKNLNPEWKEKIDFWGNNAITYISAIMTRLFNSSEYRENGYFTLPHVIALTLQSYDHVIPWLSEDIEVSADAQQIITPYNAKAEGQIAGATSSAQSAIAKLNLPNIFHILTEINAEKHNIIDLDITRPDNAKILCLGNSSRLSEAITPVLSCLSYVLMNNMNQPGKMKSIFMYDEFPTINLYGVDKFIAEARKHKISTILALQDFKQAERDYGEKSAYILRTSSANQFFGSTGNLQSAKSISDSLGKIKKAQKSVTKQKEGGGSDTESLQREEVLQPRDIMSQPAGHFLCKIADGEPAYSNVQFKQFDKDESIDVPPFNFPNGYTVESYLRNPKETQIKLDDMHNRIAKNTQEIVFYEARKILNDFLKAKQKEKEQEIEAENDQ